MFHEQLDNYGYFATRTYPYLTGCFEPGNDPSFTATSTTNPPILPNQEIRLVWPKHLILHPSSNRIWQGCRWWRQYDEWDHGTWLGRQCSLKQQRGDPCSGGASEGREGAEPPQIRSKPPQIQSKTLNFLKSGAWNMRLWGLSPLRFFSRRAQPPKNRKPGAAARPMGVTSGGKYDLTNEAALEHGCRDGFDDWAIRVVW